MEPNQQGTPNASRDRQVGDPSDRPIGSGIGGTGVNKTQPVGDREYDDIEKRFNVQPLGGDRLETHKKIMFDTKDLATRLIETIPNNRERALALTRLEEVGFWCEKALIHGVQF